MTIKIAFSRPTATIEERDTLFNHYLSAGFDGLQLKAGQYVPYLNQPDRFVEEWGHLPEVGSALIVWGGLDEQGIRQLRSIFRLGRRIGTELVVFCHNTSRREVNAEDIRQYASKLSELGKEARQSGLSLSLHHHYNQPVMLRDDFELFFDQVKDGSVGLTVDTGHLMKSGITDIAELITSFRQVINNFHLKDYANGEWKVLGEGSIPFDPVYQAIRNINYTGWISADEESGGDVLGGMANCLAHIKEGLSRMQ